VKINRKIIAIAAGVAAVAGIAFGATYAIGGSGEKVSGPAADDAQGCHGDLNEVSLCDFKRGA